MDIEQALRIDELRAGFLRYTRAAYALLPPLGRPRILDIGCGSGLPTIELARLSGGDVVGIDPDQSAISRLRQRAEQAGLSHRVEAVSVSLADAGFPAESFDLLWEEGVLHQLDLSASLTACGRLLKLGELLVMGETIPWFEGVRERLGAFGFRLVNQYLWPRHCWWTDYYAPLEASIRALRVGHGDCADLAGLARYECEVSMVKADPDRFDCGFFLVQKDCAARIG